MMHLHSIHPSMDAAVVDGCRGGVASGGEIAGMLKTKDTRHLLRVSVSLAHVNKPVISRTPPAKFVSFLAGALFRDSGALPLMSPTKPKEPGVLPFTISATSAALVPRASIAAPRFTFPFFVSFEFAGQMAVYFFSHGSFFSLLLLSLLCDSHVYLFD
ncbi:hypothetical protein B0T24DRAFT_33281 [Lasiosphaeria ovina]|uniref:Uncharacterized protein n=1 Tax=Lasiosphaeria ovina TaxID=92902 RepID=A0AAE0NK96_9PEZI|nr:hypothetical protein B0T24DRAFT_33281 [Lasiosphaeria ovina]